MGLESRSPETWTVTLAGARRANKYYLLNCFEKLNSRAFIVYCSILKRPWYSRRYLQIPAQKVEKLPSTKDFSITDIPILNVI